MIRQLLPALAVTGLLIGCGSSKNDRPATFVPSKQDYVEANLSPSDQGGNECDGPATDTDKLSLAEYLPGKRMVLPMPLPKGQPVPPALANMQLLMQFEKNGNFTVGMVMNGKAMKQPMKEALKYKVDKQKVTILKNGKADGGMVFTGANPKKGTEVKLTNQQGKQEFALKIISVGKAGPLKNFPAGGPFGPAPKKAPDLEK